MKSCVVPVILLISIFTTAAPPTPSGAQSVNRCIDSCFDTFKPSPGTTLRDMCVARCGQSGAAKAPPGPYGAIAFGLVDAAEGISWGKPSPAVANQAAMAACRKYGNNCKVVFNYANTCAAIAVAKGGEHITTATASSAKQAQRDSEASCKRAWGVCLSDKSACSP